MNRSLLAIPLKAGARSWGKATCRIGGIMLLLGALCWPDAGVNAQTLTRPKVFLPLDGQSHIATPIQRYAASSLGKTIDVSAVVEGTPLAAADHRHGVYHGAFSFQSTNRLKISNATGSTAIPSFFGIPGSEELKAFTISCWIYVDPDETVKRYIYYGVNAANKLGFGLVLKGKDLFLIKYVNNATAEVGQKLGTPVIGNSWECSFRGPAIFGAGKGWYQVILVQEAYYTRVFVGMPPEQSGGGWVGKIGQFGHNFSGNMVMHGRQDLSSFTKWGLGLPEGMTNEAGVRSPVLKMEDFMVFDYDMTESQAEALYHCQAAGASEKCLGEGQVYSQYLAIIGDYGCDGGQSNDPLLSNPVGKVANMVKAWVPHYILSVGDDSYTGVDNYPHFTCGSSYGDNVEKYYYDYIDRYNMANNRFFPVMGNHDRDCPPNTQQPYHCPSGVVSYYRCSCIWEDFFPTEKYAPDYDPATGTAPNGGRYYTFTRGNIQFFGINSNKEEPDTNRYKNGNGTLCPQAQWLKDALAASTATFKVVYLHHPPYSSRVDGHGGNNAMDTMNTWPFKAMGADIVIAGDNHFYERSDYRNLTVVVNGTSGYPGLAEASTIMPGMRQHIEKEFGAIYVQANDTVMHFQYITIDPQYPADRTKDRLRDEFWLYKSSRNGFYDPVIESTTGSTSRQITKAAPPAASLLPAEENAVSGMVVFPNPTTGDLTVRLDGQVQGTVTLKMVDAAGREAYAQRFFLSKGQRQLALGNLKTKGVVQGVYVLQLITTEGTRSVKVIVQ